MKKFRSIIAAVLVLVAQVSPFIVVVLTVATPTTTLGSIEWKLAKADVAVLVTLALKEPAIRAQVLKKLRGILLNPKYDKVALKWAEEVIAESVAKAPKVAESGKQLLRELEAISSEASELSPSVADSSGISGLPKGSPGTQIGTIPKNATDTLAQIEATEKAPPGFKGGSTFLNDGRSGGQVLPTSDSAGNPITYREWDVNPKTGADRGSQRLLTGSDGSAWFTANHYKSFQRIK